MTRREGEPADVSAPGRQRLWPDVLSDLPRRGPDGDLKDSSAWLFVLPALRRLRANLFASATRQKGKPCGQHGVPLAAPGPVLCTDDERAELAGLYLWVDGGRLRLITRPVGAETFTLERLSPGRTTDDNLDSGRAALTAGEESPADGSGPSPPGPTRPVAECSDEPPSPRADHGVAALGRRQTGHDERGGPMSSALGAAGSAPGFLPTPPSSRKAGADITKLIRGAESDW